MKLHIDFEIGETGVKALVVLSPDSGIQDAGIKKASNVCYMLF